MKRNLVALALASLAFPVIAASPLNPTQTMLDAIEQSPTDLFLPAQSRWKFDDSGRLVFVQVTPAWVVRWQYNDSTSAMPSAMDTGDGFAAVEMMDPFGPQLALLPQHDPKKSLCATNTTEKTTEKVDCVLDVVAYNNFLAQSSAMYTNVWSRYPVSSSGESGAGGTTYRPAPDEVAKCKDMCGDVYTWAMVMCTAVALINPTTGAKCGLFQTTLWQSCKWKCEHP